MKNTNQKINKYIKLLIYLCIILNFIFLVEYILKLFKIPEYIIPLPSSIGKVFLIQYDYLISETGVTMFESVVGFIIGNTIACWLAIIFALFPFVEKFGIAIAVFIKATPIVALAPIFIIWFGNGLLGKCLMAALICFFPTVINATTGLKSADTDVLEYLKSLGASQWQIIKCVKIPSSIPYIFAAAKTSSTISIVGAIVAELSGSDRGIGHILLISIYQLETSIMFAAIFCIATSGVLFYYIISCFEQLFKKYSGSYNSFAI